MTDKTVYDKRHGGPFDRGAADSYYRRAFNPHFYPEGTGFGPRIEQQDMTQADVDAYTAGYDYNEREGCHKEW